MLKNIIISLRPLQWVKNLIVFAALIFSLNLLKLDLFLDTSMLFIAFCLASSAIYLFNDLQDIEHDQKHPIKKTRPIAAGKLKPSIALSTAIFLFLCTLIFTYFINFNVLLVVIIFFFINYVYSLGLKNIPIVDALIIAFGFLLRVIAGAMIIAVNISPWLLIATFLLALFISFGKRRHELMTLEENASAHRKSLGIYTLPFIDQIITILTAATIVVYLLYTVSGEIIQKIDNPYLILTSIFVIYGIFRYLYLINNHHKADNPTQLIIRDPGIMINNGLWLISIIIILYYL